MVGWIILVSCIVVILLCLLVLFFDKIKAFFEKHFFQKRVYKVLHYYVDEEDHLLLNNVRLYLTGDENNKPTKIDHIVFADKYVYIVANYYAVGGIYGNVADPNLFLKGYDNKINNIVNPVIKNEIIVKKLENALHVDHADKLFVSVVVCNPSLIVPKGIAKKDQNSWFLSVLELEKTIKTAEKDDVSAISHEKTEKLIKMIKEESDKIKDELSIEQRKKQKKSK